MLVHSGTKVVPCDVRLCGPTRPVTVNVPVGLRFLGPLLLVTHCKDRYADSLFLTHLVPHLTNKVTFASSTFGIFL